MYSKTDIWQNKGGLQLWVTVPPETSQLQSSHHKVKLT